MEEQAIKKVPEQLIKEGHFKTNIILPWLKTSVTLTNKRLKWFNQNTVLGLFPLGENEMTVPNNQISSVHTSTKFYLARLVGGLLLTLIGLGSIVSSGPFALILIVLGISYLLNCYTATLVIANNAGQKPMVEVSIVEKDGIQKFAEVINDTLID